MADKGILYRARRKLQVAALNLTSYEFMAKVYYFIRFKRRLNLKEPYYFNEKINWLKLYYYPNNETVVKATDKYAVHEYVREKGLGYILNDIIGVWESADDFDWNALPNELVLKCTHGAQYNIISEDKTKLNEKDVRDQINKWLSEDFGKFNSEKHYSKIKPRVICEKYLSGDMADYKFFCFNGEPKLFYVVEGLAQMEDKKVQYFNMDGSEAPYTRAGYDSFEGKIELPDNIGEMIEISKILSKDFPFVRVDLISVNGRIYFSELTFTPTAGLMKIDPPEAYERLGNYLDISKLVAEH